MRPDVANDRVEIVVKSFHVFFAALVQLFYDRINDYI